MKAKYPTLLVMACILVIAGACSSAPTSPPADTPTNNGYASVVATTVIVAASESSVSSKAEADYVADGVDDQVEIQAAMDRLPGDGGQVLLSEGTFYLSASLRPVQDITIIAGQGSGDLSDGAGHATVLKLADNANVNGIESPDDTWRQLYLRHLTLDGNKGNENSSGHGMDIDYLNLGGHYNGPGLFDVEIINWPEDGIHGETYPNLISAVALVSRGNDGYGMQALIQGSHIATPNWFAGNGKSGVFLKQGTDNWLELYVEANGERGAHIWGINNSFVKIWAKSNDWEGIYLQSPYFGGKFELHASNNAQDVSDEGWSAEVRVQELRDAVLDIVTETQEQGVNNVDGLVFTGTNNQRNVIRGAIEATGYAIRFEGSGVVDAADSSMIGVRLAGDSGAFDEDPLARGMMVRASPGYVTEASGQIDITEGRTSVDVTHGLAAVPTVVLVTPQGVAGVGFWVDQVGEATLRINLEAPETVDTSFYWEAKVR